MFRTILLASVIVASPQIAKADVFSEFGKFYSGGPDYNGYEILYQFDPITQISGTITSAQLVFSGGVTPGVTNARGIVATATITPHVSFSNGQTSSINTITVPQIDYTGTPQTLFVLDNKTVGAETEFITFSSTSTYIPYNIFATTTYQNITLFSTINSETGPGFFPNEGFDNTRGGGSLELFVTYDPVQVAVPEPASLAMLGIGLLGLVGLNHRRKA